MKTRNLPARLLSALFALSLSLPAAARVPDADPPAHVRPSTDELTKRLSAAMSSWVAPTTHAYYEPRAVTETRYQRIARAVATVTLDPDREPLFAGPEGRERTAFLLASIASYESHFTRSIEQCQKGGDGGKAWSLWQTHRPRAAVCISLEAGALAAIDLLRDSLAACRDQAPADRLAAYTDGVCRSSRASRERYGRAVVWLREHPSHVQH